MGFLAPWVLGKEGLDEPEANFYIKKPVLPVSVFVAEPLSVGVGLSAAYPVAGVGGLS